MSNKVAICFYGNMRGYASTLNDLLEYFGKDVDYFISTSDIVHNFNTGVHEEVIDDDKIKDLFSGYNLISHRIVSAKHLSSRFNNSYNKYLAAMYLWNDSLSLKFKHELLNNVHYDIVCVLRPDAIVQVPHRPDLINADITDEWVSSKKQMHCYTLNDYMTMNDVIIIGTNKTISLLANACAWTHMKESYNISHCRSEDILQMYMMSMNIIPLCEITHIKYLKCPIIVRRIHNPNQVKNIYL